MRLGTLLALAALGLRQPADEVGQEAVARRLELGVLVQEVVDLPGLVGDPHVEALLGDDVVDRWEEYIDLMADSIYLNSGRGCINTSGVWASRHTKEIAAALKMVRPN